MHNNQEISFSSATKKGAALTLQIGDTSADFNQMEVSVGDMHADALGIADVDISTRLEQEQPLIRSKLRSTLYLLLVVTWEDPEPSGAYDQQSERNCENMTAAESRIRDVDMANEMMAYTRNNIFLVQSSRLCLLRQTRSHREFFSCYSNQ